MLNWHILVGPCCDDNAISYLKTCNSIDLVAIDSGADVLLNIGLTPKCVVGDLDSLRPETAEAFAALLKHIPEQETNDFHKALRAIDRAPYLGLGLLGGRLDHSLANLSTLARTAEQKGILLDAENCVFLCPPLLSLSLPIGTPLSLYPLGDVFCSSEGLLWPTDGLHFSPLGRLGTSNTVDRPEVVLRASSPAMLVILPRAHLPAVMTGLEQAKAWPKATQLPKDTQY